MKQNRYILFLIIILGGIYSCNLDEILTEEPKDFLSPENSYVDKESFESALANIYLTIRNDLYADYGNWKDAALRGLDLDITARMITDVTYREYYFWNQLTADHEVVENWWPNFYNWIYQANTIIDRSEEDAVTWNSEEEKNAIVGEAKFIRAFAYHFLANMWGGVPLVLEETTSAKTDYTRATREEIYDQCKEDLEFAVQWISTIDIQEGGRAPRAAAYHLLTEVNICLEDYDGAIEAASNVIDNSNFYLMTERFGGYTNFSFNGYDYMGEDESWGDVYWDLFREGNMNRLDGNYEAIWNVQFDYDATGGGNTNNYGGKFYMGQWAGPNWCVGLSDINGVSNYLKDTLNGYTVGALASSNYVDSVIWMYNNDWDNDIRNSKYNIQRSYYWTNPESDFYGEKITYDNISTPVRFNRLTKPSFKKGITAVHHGVAQTNGQNHDYGRIYKDWYIMRLSETYLLRAEAYFRNGNTSAAAADINTVRSRAQATSVGAGEVDLDLILDERARELYMEEFRLSTLMRMEKLSEYLMKYNHAVINSGYSLDDHINLFPIPASEIEANTGATLEQNPGY